MGNKSSSIALLRNHAIVFIENVWNKLQISILNLNIPTSKWDDAAEPTINHFYKIGNISFGICSFKCVYLKGVTQSTLGCGDGWSLHGDECYMLIQEHVNWFTAVVGHLFHLKTYAHLRPMYDFISEFPNSSINYQRLPSSNLLTNCLGIRNHTREWYQEIELIVLYPVVKSFFSKDISMREIQLD